MGQGLGPIRFLFAASAAPAPDLHVVSVRALAESYTSLPHYSFSASPTARGIPTLQVRPRQFPKVTRSGSPASAGQSVGRKEPKTEDVARVAQLLWIIVQWGH